MITVLRTSFFNTRGAGKTLAYEEHSPGRECKAHSICNCTDKVTERPEGEPDDVCQVIEVTGRHHGMEARLSVNSRDPACLHSLFRWPRKPEDEAIRVDKNPWPVLKRDAEGKLFEEKLKEDEASFNFSPHHLKLTIAMPGYGLTDHFFGNAFFGNQIDISTLFNGHSPSRLVDLSKLGPEDLWVHACEWGNEAMRVFKGPEAAIWHRRRDEVRLILACLEAHLGATGDVHTIRAALEAGGLQTLVAGLQERLAAMIVDFRQTEMFRLCDEVYRETRNAVKAQHEAEKARS